MARHAFRPGIDKNRGGGARSPRASVVGQKRAVEQQKQKRVAIQKANPKASQATVNLMAQYGMSYKRAQEFTRAGVRSLKQPGKLGRKASRVMQGKAAWGQKSVTIRY